MVYHFSPADPLAPQIESKIRFEEEVGPSTCEARADDGPLVKRLRRGPLTPQTWVRFPHGSPFFHGNPNSLFTNGGACAKIIALRRAGKRAAETALFPFLWKGQSVLITMRVHPFPFRTRKLSSSVPTILGWRRPGKIGRCRHRCSSIAQSVEHAAVNRGVVG